MFTMMNRTTPLASIVGIFPTNKQIKTEFKREGILNSKRIAWCREVKNLFI
jgi:hypothetical protein